VLKPEAERALKSLASFRECAKDCPEMVVVPAGEFMMGSPTTEMGRFTHEGPQRSVTIAKRLAVSKFDVTFADWDACVSVGGCPHVSDSGFERGTRPVINLSWAEAQQYGVWLSKMTGRPYRLLPSHRRHTTSPSIRQDRTLRWFTASTTSVNELRDTLGAGAWPRSSTTSHTKCRAIFATISGFMQIHCWKSKR
jgi:hypothetical protein